MDKNWEIANATQEQKRIENMISSILESADMIKETAERLQKAFAMIAKKN